MKSIKKRFRQHLAELSGMARGLLVLSNGIALLQPVQDLAQTVLQACDGLEAQTEALDKVNFAAQIANADALLALEAIADQDVISLLEQRFASLLEKDASPDMQLLLAQLLDNLEVSMAQMCQLIQQLGGLLNTVEQA